MDQCGGGQLDQLRPFVVGEACEVGGRRFVCGRLDGFVGLGIDGPGRQVGPAEEGGVALTPLGEHHPQRVRSGCSHGTGVAAESEFPGHLGQEVRPPCGVGGPVQVTPAGEQGGIGVIGRVDHAAEEVGEALRTLEPR